MDFENWIDGKVEILNQEKNQQIVRLEIVFQQKTKVLARILNLHRLN